MKHKLIVKTAMLGLFCALTSAAMGQVAGMTTATAPALTTGDVVGAYATGEVWATVVAPNIYFHAQLIVDGTTVWENATGKGTVLPVGWPGLTFTYNPTYTLTPGPHVVTWKGTYAPQLPPKWQSRQAAQ